jgi:hypothetical protein
MRPIYCFERIVTANSPVLRPWKWVSWLRIVPFGILNFEKNPPAGYRGKNGNSCSVLGHAFDMPLLMVDN